MLDHSTAEPTDLELFEEFFATGAPKALFQAVLDGCAKQDDEHRHRHDHPFLNDRAGGHDRWQAQEQECLHAVARYGMETYWTAPTRDPHQRLAYHRWGKLLVSVHRVTVRGNVAPYAIHREGFKLAPSGLFVPSPAVRPVRRLLEPAPKQIGEREWVMTPNQLLDLFEEEGLRHWMLTSERTMNRFPKWSVMGMPIRGLSQLALQQDMMHRTKYILPADRIDLNEETQTPPEPKFGDPDDKEGNDT